MAPDLMRLRFAPSPTGALHIGGARTALFNWLLARGSGGTLVLRIEDTDRERSTEQNVEQILDALGWLQLDWDEGPIFQSRRAERHRQVLEGLLAAGQAYRSQATSEDVAEYKREQGAGRGFRGRAEAEGAVRLRVPEGGSTTVRDAIRGDTRFEHSSLDDPVIARADGSPLYNFAVAVDDLDARISHVVRGEDHLSNTPKQLLVLEAAMRAGLAPQGSELPIYAHLPLLHGPDGKKLSKRHGAASVQELRDAGYLPEAVRNYLALLGWGSGDDRTVLSTPELIERFTLERVSHSPARFDEVKLRWLDGVHLRELGVPELARRLEDFIAAAGLLAREDLQAQPQTLLGAAAISREKIQTLADFWPLAGFFFADPVTDEQAAERWLKTDGLRVLAKVREALAALRSFDQSALEGALNALVERLGVRPREVFQPLRVAIAGTTVSPGIFESVALLGRERTLARVDAALRRG
jgi:glutamyl-tRNA synthetase